MAVQKVLTIDQGADYKHHILVLSDGVPIDFVAGGYDARLEVKPSFTDPQQILFLDSPQGSPIVNGKITFHEGGVTGRLTISLVPSDTIGILIDGETADFVYDLEIINGVGFVTRIHQGEFIINKNITTTD